jgi:hypothetical protein
MADVDAQPMDSKRINTAEEYDIIYWSKVLGVSRVQLLAAIEKVGNSVGAVKRHLEK